MSQYCAQTSAKQAGIAHGVVMWWTLDMDVDGEITLTTAPRWSHPDSNDRPVRFWQLLFCCRISRCNVQTS